MAGIWEDDRRVKKERRKVLRIKAELPIQISYNGKMIKGKTGDISKLGASCFINESIPEFTRVETAISFPIRDEELRRKLVIEVPVIIVNSRRIANKTKKYRIGFYFDDLSTSFQSRIKESIKRLKKHIREERKQRKTEA